MNEVHLSVERDQITIGDGDEDEICVFIMHSDESETELIYSRSSWQKIIDSIGEFL